MVKITRKERHYIDYIDEYEIPASLYEKLFVDREAVYSGELWESLTSYHVGSRVDEVSNRSGEFDLDVDIEVHDGEDQ
jgi:hypothetical protein